MKLKNINFDNFIVVYNDSPPFYQKKYNDSPLNKIKFILSIVTLPAQNWKGLPFCFSALAPIKNFQISNWQRSSIPNNADSHSKRKKPKTFPFCSLSLYRGSISKAFGFFSLSFFKYPIQLFFIALIQKKSHKYIKSFKF